jgi:hypothetical protein
VVAVRVREHPGTSTRDTFEPPVRGCYLATSLGVGCSLEIDASICSREATGVPSPLRAVRMPLGRPIGGVDGRPHPTTVGGTRVAPGVPGKTAVDRSPPYGFWWPDVGAADASRRRSILGRALSHSAGLTGRPRRAIHSYHRTRRATRSRWRLRSRAASRRASHRCRPADPTHHDRRPRTPS